MFKEKSIEQTETIDTGKLREITVEAASSDVEITVHEAARVDVTLLTSKNGPELVVDHSGDKALIQAKRPKEQRWLFGIYPQSRLLITVPKDVAEYWNVRTGSGDICLNNVETKELSLMASSGDVQLEEITTKTAEMKVSSGDVQAYRCVTDQVKAAISSGDLDWDGFVGELSARASSGDIDLTNIGVADLDLVAASGDVTLVFAEKELNLELDAMIASGEMDVDLPLKMQKLSKRKVTGIAGDGRNRVRVKVASGDVRIC
ncbi:DUF4097 family beta strand repeat-containing protein [Lentibacillus sediminis]|uniref:DUF4097 family beta strand repeat-containing protein n=1 Tax=Lentibacillus sediminis TaxID=1940529 RepID=UPI000C1BA4EB|nr:DUF4097 family beta strand repeat-containing protein [Lentibacillus sediminis]